MNVTTGSRKVHRPGAKNSANQTTALCGKVMAHRLFRTDAPANCKACDDAVIAEQNAPSAERIAELHPAAVTETSAPLDIPAAVREYIEAEWRGAALVMSAKRGEIIAALLAADPELSNTAATFRFHNLVAEMRDNDSITPQPLPGVAEAVAANDGLPLNVVTKSTAESLAVLQAISDATPVGECVACAAGIVMCPDHCATCNGSSTYAVCRNHDAA